MARKKKKRSGTGERKVTASSEISSSTLQSREFRTALLSAVLLCAAFPPIGFWPIAFVAPIGWLRIIRQRNLPSRHRFLGLYLAGFVHWMILVQWVRLPHWSAYFGWVVLSAYLAVYVPAFILASRALVHMWRIPLVIAAPIAWTGMELARGYLFTGFSISLLGHAVVQVPVLTQVADLFGAYGVSFVIVAVSAGIEILIPSRRSRTGHTNLFSQLAPQSLMTITWPVGLVVATLVYGWTNVGQDSLTENVKDDASSPVVHVALVQAVYDTEFDNDKELGLRRAIKAFDDYLRISRRACTEAPNPIDLIIWPESMFSTGWRHQSYATFGTVDARPDLDMTRQQWQEWLEVAKQVSDSSFIEVTSYLRAEMIVGLSRFHATGDTADRFNSVFHLDEQGRLTTQYDKMHPVMFGEYVPLGNVFPWLYKLTPMGAGLTPGTSPVVVTVKGIRFCPSICFENTVPHLIRGQVDTLAQRGEEPDCLLTVTNDGWFWGSSLLDVHLACGVFRAIENRKPMLIAANTGISAWIDEHGKINSRGPRRDEGFVHATVSPSEQMPSLYRRIGDWPAATCFFVSIAALGASIHRDRRGRTP